MNKKQKGINYDTQIDTVNILLQRINEELDKRREEIEAKDRANAELLTKVTGEESSLMEEISRGKKIVEKMISDYRKIEADVETSERKKAEENVLRESDVRSGKVSLAQFREKGKYDKDIAAESLRKSVFELETSLTVIREKNLENLKLREKLGSCRNTIRNLTLRPGLTMLEMLKSVYDFTDIQVADFMGELESLRTGWNQTKQDLLLIEGKSMSGRHVWTGLSMDEAKALQFSPLLPLSCVEKLKSELAKYKGSEGISITYYVNLKDVEITNIMPKRGVIQIIDLKENKQDAKFTREKAGR